MNTPKTVVSRTVTNQNEFNEAAGKWLKTYDVPEARIDEICTYLAELRRKNPKMKHDRLLRKGAEYFHLTKKA